MNPPQESVDALFAQWDHLDTPGCALAVIQDGEIVTEPSGPDEFCSKMVTIAFTRDGFTPTALLSSLAEL